ncbi:MAG TPA: FG-GAP-like repeat-containing protein [Myxococcales bacterium]|nr:FG-GAP-like repeat-containing protein [Myxococcales bacterium]
MNRSTCSRSWPLLALAALAACSSSPGSGGGTSGGLGLGTGGGSGGSPDSGFSCAANQIACGGSCVDPKSDPANCGACLKSCATGQACVAGTCTATCTGASGTLCGGVCVDLQSDQANCGACGKACAAGEACSKGACTAAGGCPSPLTSCTSGELSTCTNLADDPANCGSCGHGCGSGVACLNSQCQACAPGATLCGTTCTDTQTDPANCGGCASAGGHACTSEQLCKSGACVNVCAADAGQTACPEGASVACVDVSTDVNNCGACGKGCAAGQGCDGGTCSCPTGRSLCGSGAQAACIDTSSDPQNCGACGQVCSSDLCHAGSCLFCAAGTYAFGSLTEVPAGSEPSPAGVADFNGDGRPDLAAANVGDGTLGILLGTGSGFAAQIAVPIALDTAALAVGPLDRNGHPDVATLSGASDGVSVAVTQVTDGGATSFSVIGPFACTATLEPAAVAIADVNGDELPDLIVGGTGITLSPPFVAGTLDIFHQQADGGFPAQSDQTLTAGQSVQAIAALKLGVDGGLALATADQMGGAVVVIPAANLSAAASYTVGNGPVALAAADLNGDGAADLVVLNQIDSTVNVLTAQTGGSFNVGTAISVAGTGYLTGITLIPEGLTLGDVNGDGVPDILVTLADFTTETGDDSVEYLINQGNGTFAPPVSVPAAGSGFSPASIVLHDLNGDGLPDLALGNGGSGSFAGVLYGQCP